jgi:DNA-directed RNA polymerase subunit RPC12/RpoP
MLSAIDVNEPSQAGEVRQCASCKAATLICIHSWRHRVLGIDTETWTLEFECQTCRAKVILFPHKHIWVDRLFAFLLLPAIFPSVFFFASARRKARAYTDNPVVNAPSPTRPAGPADRVCNCGGPARCTAIIVNETRWTAIARRSEYICRRCAATFTVHDLRGIVFAFIAAVALSAAGALMVAFPPGAAVYAQRNNQWFGFALLLCAAIACMGGVLRVRIRRIHPEIL